MTVGLNATNLANKILNHLSGVATWTAPSALYLRLHTGDPGAAGTTAGAAGDTTRKAVTFAAASAGSIVLNGTPPLWTNTVGTSESLTYWSLWDAPTGGTCLWTGALGAPQAWVSGNTYSLPAGSTLALAPIAV